MRILTFREIRKRCKILGFHCHHVIPIAVVEHRALARTFGRARSAGFEPQNFATNGMHLPSTEEHAVAFRLPLHRGPHKVYNEIVANHISNWAGLPPHELLEKLCSLQNSLKRGLRRGPVAIGTSSDLGLRLTHDFQRLDVAIERLIETDAFG